MIKKIFLLFIVYTATYSQSVEDVFPKLNKRGMTSDILYNPAGISNISLLENKKQHMFDYYQTYKSISFSDYKNRLNNLELIKKLEKNETLSNNVLFGIIFTEFDMFEDNIDYEDVFRVTKRKKYKRKSNKKIVFKTKRLLVAAGLKQIQRGKKVTFEIKEEAFVNTTKLRFLKTEIDFDDGLGFRELKVGETVSINYDKPGDKQINTRILLSDNSSIESFSTLKVILSNEEFSTMNNQEVIGFNSSEDNPPYIQPYNEYPFRGFGEMSIFHSSDGVLDKPIFLVDGFDPLDSRNIAAIYSQLDYSGGNLGDTVRAQGYDIVVLNFPTYFRQEDQVWIYGGADYIERNAMLLVELIKFINNSKVGNEKNVVIGPSMGGLISRYALNYMESQNIDHDTRLYISFDAPHTGANVPIGFQHMFNFLAYGLDTWVGDFSVEALRPLVDGMLKSPAARQMLWDHFEPHLQSGSADFDNGNALPKPHPFYDIFYNAIDNVGLDEYPVNTRNVAIINGSGNLSKFNFKNGNPVNPGDQVLAAFLPEVASYTDAYLDSWYTPDVNVTSTVSKVYIDAPGFCFCDITSEALSKSHGHTAGPDTASGGLFNIVELASTYAVSDPLVSTFINELQTNYFTFIPSISGMDYFTNNWNDFMGNPDRTPFDAWSMPNENQEHVKLTPQNVEFALNEIYNGETAVNNQETPALVFVNNDLDDVTSGVAPGGKIYANGARGASRDINGNSNAAFGNIGDWSVDLTVSEKSPSQAASDFGIFKDNQHPIYQGSDVLTQNHDGMGALGWGSFTANSYNRAAGTGSVAMGFNSIAGTSSGNGPFILDATNNVGQTVFGYASRALGNVSFAAGFRNTAQGNNSVAMGNFNYATGDSSLAIGNTNYAEGGNSIAIGFKSHAAGDASVSLGQENVSWGTTNFTAGYQNAAGDTTQGVGTGGSAVAMGFKNIASGESSAAFNKLTKAINQASVSMGIGTTANNFGMLAIGVNNDASIGTTDSNYYNQDGQQLGEIGVAFVIGNGDINTQTNTAGTNPSNAFVVKYDGSANLAGDFTINSDARLKSNIISLGGTLAKLMKIDGKSYTMKSNEKVNKIGLLAQEIEEVFPELVKEGEDKDGTLSVNYQGLIPVLINAIKEQQEELKVIRKSVNEDR